MRLMIPALLLALLVSACAQPSPDVRSARWENNASILTAPTANQ